MYQHRAADVIEAIKATQAWTAHAGAAEQHHLSVTQVQGTCCRWTGRERHYSVELAWRWCASSASNCTATTTASTSLWPRSFPGRTDRPAVRGLGSYVSDAASAYLIR